MTAPAVAIRPLPAAEAEGRLDDLAAVLLDAVRHGAGVNFLADFTHGDARAFWRGQLAGLTAEDRRLLVAEDSGRIVGMVVLFFALQPNGPHRAEIGKMLVLATHRRRGLGRALLAAAEDAARSAGRTLLVLDTEEGSDGERLYLACGWVPVGTIPGYALTTAGQPVGATVFYKRIG